MRYLAFSKGHTNHFLDVFRPVAIFVAAHLTTYCNCYVNKTLFSFSQHFLFYFFPRTFYSQPHIATPEFLFALPSMRVWPIISGTPYIFLLLVLNLYLFTFGTHFIKFRIVKLIRIHYNQYSFFLRAYVLLLCIFHNSIVTRVKFCERRMLVDFL